MNKFVIEVTTNAPLTKMIKLLGKIEKLINESDSVVKQISVNQIGETE